MKVLMTLPAPGHRRRRPSWLFRAFAVVLGALVLYVAFFAVSASGVHLPLAGADGSEQPRTAWRGAYHVHSTISHDGRGSIEAIAQAARAAGLQFVVLADHNPAELFAPKFVDGVLVIGAQELSTPNGHLVALGASRALTEAERNGDVFAAIDSLGGTAYLSHPAQQKNPWRDWPSAKKARGMELYSADSMFREALRSPFKRLIPAASAYLTNPVLGLLTVAGPQPRATARVVELANAQPYAALCAHDAHGLPAYQSVFETLAVYTSAPPAPKDANGAAAHVLEHLGSGLAWCVFQGIAPGDGFALSSLQAHPGDTITVQLPTAAPPQVQLRVWGPGVVAPDGRSVEVTGTGAVQIEVWAQVPGIFFEEGWRPWLVPSPIRVVPEPATPPGSPEPSAVSDGGP